MKRAITCLALLLAATAGAQDLDHVRKAHLWPALLSLPGGNDLGDTWTCAAASTTCTADTSTGAADTNLAGGETVWCSDGSHWYSYTVDGDPSTENTWKRTKVYPDGTVDSLRALTGVTCIELTGLGATEVAITDGNGTDSALAVGTGSATVDGDLDVTGTATAGDLDVTGTATAAALEVGGGPGGSGAGITAAGAGTFDGTLTTGLPANQTGGAGTGGGETSIRVNSANGTVYPLQLYDTHNPTTGQLSTAVGILARARFTADGETHSDDTLGSLRWYKKSDYFGNINDRDGGVQLNGRINGIERTFLDCSGNGATSLCTFAVFPLTTTGVITGGGGVETYLAAAGSVITFAGADAAGNWTLIDFSGAGGINDASDYLLYHSATINWDGLGKLTAPTVVAGTELVIPNGAAPPATCTAGAIFLDTDETNDTNCATTADNSLCLCTAANTWAALENN